MKMSMKKKIELKREREREKVIDMNNCGSSIFRSFCISAKIYYAQKKKNYLIVQKNDSGIKG